MKKSFVLAMAFLLLNTPSVVAQTKLYSLQDVWQSILQHYPSLKAGKQNLQAQELRKVLVKESYLPDIAVQAQQSYGSLQNAPGSFFPLPGIYTTTGNNKTPAARATGANLYSSAVMQWNFLQFGLQQKKLAAADAAILVSSARLKQEEWQLLSTATHLYFDFLANNAALHVAQAETGRFEKLLELLQSQAAAGLRPGADTMLLKSSLLQSKAKEHDYRAAGKAKLVQLAALTGENSATFTIDTAVFSRYGQLLPGVREKLQTHPYLQVLNANVQYAEAQQDIIKKERYPSIGLLAGVGVKGSGIGNDGTVHKGLAAPWQNASTTWLAGVGLTWSVSSLYQNKTRRAVAESLISAAKDEREAGFIQVQAQYEAALSGWKEQHKKLQATQEALAASREAYGLYEVRYQSGLLSLMELLQLQQALQEAESAYVTAVAAYWNELVKGAEAVGDPMLLLTAIKP